MASIEYLEGTGLDIIGDIHGHADELNALLKKLGYRERNGCFRCPGRKVLFLGDFIDRGPGQAEVLDIVMRMYTEEQALAIMGNHEFNALAYHTEHPEQPDTWLRPHSDKNHHQHRHFLEAYKHPGKQQKLDDIMQFFWDLPLWLDLGGLRAVHACWAPKQMAIFDDDNRLSLDLLVEASTQGTSTYEAIELLLKGLEYPLPNGHSFLDKDNHRRSALRVRWWINEESNLADLQLTDDALEHSSPLGSHRVKAYELVGYPEDAPPVFFGHYWVNGAPSLFTHNVACLDYSVANNGKLTAYRWDGEQVLSNDKFIHVDSMAKSKH